MSFFRRDEINAEFLALADKLVGKPFGGDRDAVNRRIDGDRTMPCCSHGIVFLFKASSDYSANLG